ncbi:MAG: ABC transporter permease [Pseudomonadota bacterium]
MDRRKTWLGWAYLAPSLLLVGILAIGLGYVIEYSLHELDIATYRLRDAYSLGNYADIATRPVYRVVLWRSVLGAILVTLITLALAFPYAYALTRSESPGLRKALLVALFLPFFIGQVVRAYGWLIVLGQQGIVNQLLGGLGLPPLDLIYNFGAVVFGLTQYMLPFAVLLILPAMAAIPRDMERASEGLGASWPSTFRHVVIPMARPGLVGAGIVVFTLTLTDFAMPEILGGGSNDFIASAIYDSFFQISNAGLGAALSVALVFVGSVFVAGFFWLSPATTLNAGGGR